jgi:hypothetical protein
MSAGSDPIVNSSRRSRSLKSSIRFGIFARMPVAQARGFRLCEFCSDAVANVERMLHADRNGERIYMGSAEIRVFARDGTAYAAPTLIYHFMKFHDYRPPDEFIRALTEGPAPWSVEYLDRLKGLGL